jgi:mono/diheme cytochrome c family protein
MSFLRPFLFALLVAILEACATNSATRARERSPIGAAPIGQVPLAATVEAAAPEPILTIRSQERARQFTRSELLRAAGARKIVIARDPSYAGAKTEYDAVPLARLFDGIVADPSATLLFVCLDGFSAPISMSRALNADAAGAIAYLAIESPAQRWPALKKSGGASAGPFYLVWEHPEKSNIGAEEWPFQLAAFEVGPSLEAQFPRLAPPSSVSARSPVRQGYRAFMKNCFACHTLNGEGRSQLGPDLNVPFNPTEYLKEGYLEKLVRGPQSLRHWPQSKMSGFDRAALSDGELRSIIAYLRHMARRKCRNGNGNGNGSCAGEPLAK